MSSRLSGLLVLAVSAVGGAGTMVVELAAVRLLAPWFGSSQVVWTNVIAVVLLALALGYVLGGRIAASAARPLRAMSTALLAGSLFAALLPALAGPVAHFFLPDGLALHEAAETVLWGSLAASIALFLVPATALGCVAPLAVQTIQTISGGAAGRAGGAVLGASTLGSLAGVFATSHVLVPTAGLTGTFLIASAALVVAGVAGLLLSRAMDGAGGGSKVPPAAAALAIASWFAVLGSGGAARPELPEGMRELAYRESEYQSVRVVSDTTTPSGELRYLQVNEGFDSFQSVWSERPGLLPPGFYYNDFALPSAWSRGSGTWRVLVLGLGAGTAVRVLEGELPEGLALDVTGVELDEVVVELAREHMELRGDTPNHRIVADVDARVALRNADGAFDQVVLDCYANQIEIPPHLCTVEFFREVRERLVDGGWLSVNLGGFGFDDPVVAAVSMSCASAFESDVLIMRVPWSRNYSLVARRGGALPIADDGTLLPARFGSDAVRALLAPRSLPGAWTTVAPPTADDALLTDDWCPIEELQLASIRAGAERLAGDVE